MGSRDKDHTMPHHPLLSSLVVRPADSGGGGAGSDYEPGEVRPDPPPHFRSDRYEDNGYRMRADSASPVRRRDDHHRLSPGFERSDGAPRTRGFGRGRGPPRQRHYSPPFGRDRFADKGYDRPGPIRLQELPRNNPNVQAREGDWVCSDPSCKNLNFARRESCNKCKRPRYAPVESPPRRGYSGHFPPPRQQRFPSPPPLNPSPRRIMYRSPPRAWSPRAVGPSPPLRRNGRFTPPPSLRAERQDYPGEDLRDRYRHEFDRGRDNNNNFNSRRGYGRRELSPLPVPELHHRPRGWAPPVRERTRSPVRGGPPVKDYRRDAYVNRGRGGRRGGFGRDRF